MQSLSSAILACTHMQVYSVSSTKSLPQWLSEGTRKSLRKNEEFQRRVELLQDFEFPTACGRIKATPDGQYLFASGLHPPQVSGGWQRCCGVGSMVVKQMHGMVWGRMFLLLGRSDAVALTRTANTDQQLPSCDSSACGCSTDIMLHP